MLLSVKINKSKNFNGFYQAVCIMVFILGFSVLSAGAAQAHVHKENISPFDKVSDPARHICPLRHSTTQPCPHKSAGDLIVQIGPDCGGNPTGQIPSSFNFNKHTVQHATRVVIPKSPPLISAFSSQPIIFFDFLFADTPKPPPRSV